MTLDQLLVLGGGIAALVWVNVYFFVLPRRKAPRGARGEGAQGGPGAATQGRSAPGEGAQGASATDEAAQGPGAGARSTP